MSYDGPNPLPVAIGGTGDSSFTAYSVITGGTTSTGALQNVSGVGTAGQFLNSAGAGALPTWSTTSATWVLLSSQPASNVASISFTSLITSTYNNYALLLSNVVPVTAGSTLNLAISSNNGSSYFAVGYTSGITAVAYNSTTWANTHSSTTCLLSNDISTTAGMAGIVYLLNLQNGAPFLATGTVTVYENTNSIPYTMNINTSSTATSVNAIQLTMSSGNISTGTFSLYGIVE